MKESEYNFEYKVRAVLLVRQMNNSVLKVAKLLGIKYHLLSDWVIDFSIEPYINILQEKEVQLYRHKVRDLETKVSELELENEELRSTVHCFSTI